MATEMSLKLLVDKKRNKVLFAEAGKDSVDFLFSLLTLPLGTVIRLLTPTQTTTGCIGNLYSSVRNLDKLYMQPKVDKSLLLEPQIGSAGNPAQTLLIQNGGKANNSKSESSQPVKPTYYRCDRNENHNIPFGHHNISFGHNPSTFSVSPSFGHINPINQCKNYVSNIQGAKCGCCGGKMMTQIFFVDEVSSTVADAGGPSTVGEESGGGRRRGYVKEAVTYMITDDLEVTPMSTISGITYLIKYEIKDISVLEDRAVRLGMEEGLDLLRASLQSKSVLTDVFLTKKGAKLED